MQAAMAWLRGGREGGRERRGGEERKERQREEVKIESDMVMKLTS